MFVKYYQAAISVLIHSCSTDPRVIDQRIPRREGRQGEGHDDLHNPVEYRTDNSRLSQYPEESEVLLMTSTQFRVQKPVGEGRQRPLAAALRCDLTEVSIVELIEVNLKYWVKDLPGALFPEEVPVPTPFLQTVAEAQDKAEWKNHCPGLRDAVTGKPRNEYRAFGCRQLPTKESLTEL